MGRGHLLPHHLSSHTLGANRPAGAPFYLQVLQEEFTARLCGSGPLLVMPLLLSYEMKVSGLHGYVKIDAPLALRHTGAAGVL